MTIMASARALALAAAGTAMVGALVFPATASAAAPAATGGFAGDHGSWGQHWDAPGDWHHPEWGPGWNDGYPAPGWLRPRDGRHRWTGFRPPDGRPRRDGLHPRGGYRPAAGHFSRCSIRFGALRRPR